MDSNSSGIIFNNLKSFKFIFRTLQYRNYRLFFIGQFISLIGTWMQQIAVSWLVYQMTHSAFLLGLIGFVSQIPTFVISPFAGVWSDRFNRYRMLIMTQTLSMIQAMVLAILVLSGAISVWQIILLSLFIGCVNAIDMPTRQSFVIHMIDERKDLSNAIALNSAMFNAARFLGPFIAGVLIAIVGEGICFLINGLSYIAVILALLAMNVSNMKFGFKKSSVIKELKDGFTYVSGDTKIKSILLLVALTSIMGVPFIVLMPAFAKDILHGGPHTLGFLMSALGGGALMGAFYLAARTDAKGLRKIINMAALLFGISLIGLSLSNYLWISLLMIFIAGFGMMVQVASSNTWLQTNVDDDKRGRVMSFYVVSFMGMAPFGSLLAGSMARAIGISNTIFIGGTVCILGAILFLKLFHRFQY
ncbi:MAG: MFS transporter [Smithellaceae bacterium]